MIASHYLKALPKDLEIRVSFSPATMLSEYSLNLLYFILEQRKGEQDGKAEREEQNKRQNRTKGVTLQRIEKESKDIKWSVFRQT
jgi:hypothetical protein